MLLARWARPRRRSGTAAVGVAAVAALVVDHRRVVVGGWLVLVAAAVLWLPAPQGGGVGDLDDFAPDGNPYVATEVRSAEAFGFPLLSRTVVVQRDPDGLSPYTQAAVVLRAAAVNEQQYPWAGPVRGALPLLNVSDAFPGARESGTTGLTYLLMSPDVGLFAQTRAGERFAAQLGPDDDVVGVTGSFPARVAQDRLVDSSLRTVEVATVSAIFVIMAAGFRSLVAPLLTLGTAGVAFVLTLHVAGAVGEVMGVAVPAELRPLLLALLLGVVTDYAVFFLAGTRTGLAEGRDRVDAARRAVVDYLPVVVVAGVTVAAGTASLLAARGGVIRTFGPGMAIAVLVALAVSVTLLPAVLAMLGPAAFWPARPGPDGAAVPVRPRRARFARVREPLVGRLVRTRTAAVVAVTVTVLLGLLALPVRGLELGLSFVPSLPPADPASRAAVAAAEGFAPGILSPTVVLVEGEDLTEDVPALSDLRERIEADPGVAGVLGPGYRLLDEPRGLVLSEDGTAARYLVVLADEPLGATAVHTFERLEAAVPRWAEDAGLAGAQVSLGGDTALASLLTSSTRADLARIAVAVLLVNLLVLVLFLRATVLPLYLLGTSVLSLLAALGLTTWVFQDLLGHDGLTFYVPFAAAVLLVALGSDYNIYGVGRLWHVARDVPLRAAVVQVVPRTSRAITVAALTLAVSFGLLSLVPLRPFRELAFVMAVGILLDAVLVRVLLVPALLVLLERWNRWPLPRRPVGSDDTTGVVS
ncbi:MMPL family transporter [Aquipuribacter nitratireducens]|uniref:MMPL family transporter n=1 Tax=Aquipuribacter nitratireducens TaxID=650104 RepID=A0ABW0GP34_9MICO